MEMIEAKALREFSNSMLGNVGQGQVVSGPTGLMHQLADHGYVAVNGYETKVIHQLPNTPASAQSSASPAGQVSSEQTSTEREPSAQSSPSTVLSNSAATTSTQRTVSGGTNTTNKSKPPKPANPPKARR